jgi:hypothetical protein
MADKPSCAARSRCVVSVEIEGKDYYAAEKLRKPRRWGLHNLSATSSFERIPEPR